MTGAVFYVAPTVSIVAGQAQQLLSVTVREGWRDGKPLTQSLRLKPATAQRMLEDATRSVIDWDGGDLTMVAGVPFTVAEVEAMRGALAAGLDQLALLGRAGS